MDWVGLIYSHLLSFIAGYYSNKILEKWKFKKKLLVEWARRDGEKLREMAYYLKKMFFLEEGPYRRPILLTGIRTTSDIVSLSFSHMFTEIIAIGKRINEIITHPSFPQEYAGLLRSTITFVNLTFFLETASENLDRELMKISRHCKRGSDIRDFLYKKIRKFILSEDFRPRDLKEEIKNKLIEVCNFTENDAEVFSSTIISYACHLKNYYDLIADLCRYKIWAEVDKFLEKIYYSL